MCPPLVLEITAKHSKAFAWFCTKATVPWSSSLAFSSNLFISITISHTVCWAPPLLPSVASHSTRYFCCHFATSGALNASHHRINVGISAIGLSLMTFFGIRKNIVVHACCGYLPLCSTFSMNSTIPLLVSFVKSKGTLGWKPSHSTPVFALYFLDAFSNYFHSASAALPPISSAPHSSTVYPACSAITHCIASVLTILSSSLHNGLLTSHPLLLSPRSVLLHSMVLAS